MGGRRAPPWPGRSRTVRPWSPPSRLPSWRPAEGEQTALLAAHPDLAGRAAIAGDLTADSAGEQAGAGLDRLTPEEFARFTALNDAYRARFGIPFIVAVRGADKTAILAAFENRVGGHPPEERLTAIAQVLRIVRFRLEDRVAG